MGDSTGAATRVAIVDDDEAIRRAFNRLLRAAGMEVEVFASGEEFLDALALGRFDCALLDLNMAGLSGLDVLKRMKESAMGVPAIMATAYDDPQMHEQCLAWGARAYLRKPIGVQQLLAAIAQATAPGARQERRSGEL